MTKLPPNEVRFGGYPLLSGPHNFFRLTCGVSPSFGLFRITQHAAEVLQHYEGQLTFTSYQPDPINPKGYSTDVATLNKILFIKAEPSEIRGIYDLTVADERILWDRAVLSKDYNTYKSTRKGGVGANKDYDIENTNGAKEWTYKEVLESIATEAGVSLKIDDSSGIKDLKRPPRQLMFCGVSFANAMRRLLNELGCFLVPLPIIADDTSYTVMRLGVEPKEPVLPESLNARIVNGGPILLNRATIPHEVRAYATQEPKGASWVCSDSASKPISEEGGCGVKPHITHYAYWIEYVVGGGGPNNIDKIKEYLNEAALGLADYKLDWQLYRFAGIIAPNQKLSKAKKPTPILGAKIHEITWKSNSEGAFTTMKKYRPREEPAPELPSTLFYYDGYPIGTVASDNEVTKTCYAFPFHYSGRQPAEGESSPACYDIGSIPDCLTCRFTIDGQVRACDSGEHPKHKIQRPYFPGESITCAHYVPPRYIFGEDLDSDWWSLTDVFNDCVIRFYNKDGDSWAITDDFVIRYKIDNETGELKFQVARFRGDNPPEWIACVGIIYVEVVRFGTLPPGLEIGENCCHETDVPPAQWGDGHWSGNP